MLASKDIFLKSSGGAYQISRSVRTRSSASAYFNRTFGTPTSATIWTWSGWVKRGALTGTYRLFGASTTTYLTFNSSDQLNLTLNGVSASTSTAVFRDPSAWYHIVYQQNGSAQTIYVNNASIATGTTAASIFNTAIAHQIGAANTTNYFDGYLTEINFIDGQALTPSSFGETNAVTGVWQPKKYTGTYGTNGFYLNFSDNSSNTATTIGKDYSGNGNNWTPNNISVTAGVTYDSMVDSPTMGATAANYCTWNPLDTGASTMAVSNANLTFTKSSANFAPIRGTIAVTADKYYFEMLANNSNLIEIGVSNGYNIKQNGGDNSLANSGANGAAWDSRGFLYYPSGGGSYAYTFTTNDVVMVAFDASTGKIWFGKNGTWNTGNPATGTSPAYTASGYDFLTPFANGEGGGSGSVTFGQRPFTYTPPTGFVALNTNNLPTPTISNGANYMAATTYTGTGSALTIANTVGSASFQPDLVWVKGRSGATDHALYDSVRGTTKDLASNTTAAETTQATGLTAFGSTGFTVGALAKMNTNAATYVGWQWKASGSTVSNTSGSITSTVSVGATQGFSVVTYTGTGANATVGHGLGVAPSMVITKNRGATSDWAVWHTSLTSGAYYLLLDTTAAQASGATYWNSTVPTSSVFSVGTATPTNVSTNTYVAYCFAAVAGYSAFGSYTGNGSTDGPFVYLGFRPQWFLVKVTSGTTGSWHLIDTSRSPYNQVGVALYPDSSAAESSDFASDILSNGLKIRNTQAEINQSGATYIYMAFAENPLKLSLAR